MIFDYPNNKFIEDGRNNRLLIDGFSFAIHNTVSMARLGAVDEPPIEDAATIFSSVEFIFSNGLLTVYSGGKQITDMGKLLFIMSESEVSAAQEQMYRRNMDNNSEAISRSRIFSPEIKTVLQKAIEQMAALNGITLPENINFFNDKFVLYMFPLLRGITNSSTNFYKILEDLRFSDDWTNDDNGYRIPHALLQQKNLPDAVKLYLGTSSKEIIKFIGRNLVRKTDLVKSLSPDLLNVLINHSGKIFAQGAGIEVPNVRILTCYEDVIIDVFTYLRYIMDVFSNNIDHTQKFLASKDPDKPIPFRSNRLIANFLSENFSPKKIFTIMSNEDASSSYLSDVASQYNTYKDPLSIPYKLRAEYPNGLEIPKNWKDLKELHDKVSADYNKIKAEDNNKTIPYSELEWQLHGLSKDNVTLVLPSEGSKLVEWGKEQSHCVASYSDRAANKECLIVGVKVHGKHLYTLEVRVTEHQRPIKPEPQIMSSKDLFSELPGAQPPIDRESVFSYSINQFYGYGNRTPESYGDGEVRKTVKELLGSVFTANNESGTYTYNAQFVHQENDHLDALRYALQAGNLNVQIPDVPPVIINNIAVE
jgi:hypothetical protein